MEPVQVWVVEDEPAIRAVVVRVVGRLAGFEVAGSSSALQPLLERLADASLPPLGIVLSDLFLQDDGPKPLGLAEHLGADGPRLVLMSSFAAGAPPAGPADEDAVLEDDEALPAEEALAGGHVPAPPAELAAALADALRAADDRAAMLARLAASVCHDAGNLTTAITGYGGMLRDACVAGKRSTPDAHSDAEEIVRASALIAVELRRLWRFVSPRFAQPARADAVAAVQAALTGHWERGLEATLRRPEGRVAVAADPDALAAACAGAMREVAAMNWACPRVDVEIGLVPASGPIEAPRLARLRVSGAPLQPGADGADSYPWWRPEGVTAELPRLGAVVLEAGRIGGRVVLDLWMPAADPGRRSRGG